MSKLLFADFHIETSCTQSEGHFKNPSVVNYFVYSLSQKIE